MKFDWIRTYSSLEIEKNPKLSPWNQYRLRVRELTEQNVHQLPGIENRAFKGHHVDHMISIRFGFDTGIDPEIIADVRNLRMIPHQQNLRKGIKCDRSRVKITLVFD